MVGASYANCGSGSFANANVIATTDEAISTGEDSSKFGKFFAWGSCNFNCANHDGSKCPEGTVGGFGTGATCAYALPAICIFFFRPSAGAVPALFSPAVQHLSVASTLLSDSEVLFQVEM